MWKIKTQTDTHLVKWKGYAMWAILLLSYCLFIVNWGMASGLNGNFGSGDKGIINSYFDQKPEAIFTQAINWAITIGRGIGSIIIGWLIVKFTHKWATMIALTLVLFAIPAPWMPNYGLFIGFRTIFAIGATTLIILLQPVVSAYFPPIIKGKLSLFSTQGYTLGTIITLAPFLGDAVANTAIVNQWQVILTVLAALFLIPFAAYFLIGQKFDTFEEVKKAQEEQRKALEDKNGPTPKTSMKTLLKQKETYIWILFYGGWLVAVVMPFIMMRSALPALAGIDANQLRVTLVIWLIFFHVSNLFAPYSVGLWNRFNARRKPFIIGITFLGIVFWVFSILAFLYMVVPAHKAGSNMWAGGWLFYILGFIKGLLLWGIQGVFLNNPHEQEGTNPQKVGLQFSLIWGFGYFFFTLATIILSFVRDIPDTGAMGWTIGVTLLMLLAPIAWFFIKETKPNAPYLPDLKAEMAKKSKNK
ncbi:hexose phosphate transporter [Candidatus Mycoplasma pogonae]